MTGKMTLGTFTQYLQTEFHASLGADQLVDLELIQAEDLGSTPAQERFSLLFRGALDRFLAQGLYRVTHAQLGAFDLFLAPIQKESNGFVYEAVFNLLHQ